MSALLQNRASGLLKKGSPGIIFTIFILISIFIRLPFFFRDYIDRDESTFILMGQAWVDGFLPYTELWDVKPPLNFLFYAGIIYLFGKSFIALRLAGSVVVALTAYLTYLFCRKETEHSLALVFGVLCIYLQSLFGSIQGVMSEHLLMCSYMAACYYLMRNKTRTDLFLAGLLLGVSLMIKISIAFPILCVGLFLVYYYFREMRPGRAILQLSLIGIPALLVVLATFLPYYQMGEPHIWWDSVIRAPLAYTEAGGSSAFAVGSVSVAILGFVVWGMVKRKFTPDHFGIFLMAATAIGVVLSFIKGGRVNSHYLIQLYPPLLVLLAVALAPLWKRIKGKAPVWLIALAFLLPVESYLEYRNIIRHKMERGSYYNGEGFSAPQFILDQGLETRDILFLGYHIGYWVLDTYPPVRTATHPSNLCKEEMFPYYNPERLSAMQELRHLMQTIRPKTVITRHNRRIFDKMHVEENAYMTQVLAKHYRLIKTVDQADIFVRLE